MYTWPLKTDTWTFPSTRSWDLAMQWRTNSHSGLCQKPEGKEREGVEFRRRVSLQTTTPRDEPRPSPVTLWVRRSSCPPGSGGTLTRWGEGTPSFAHRELAVLQGQEIGQDSGSCHLGPAAGWQFWGQEDPV